MPKGHEHDPLYSLSIRNIANLFREEVDHYYILTRHNVFLFSIYLFFPFTILLFKKTYYTKSLRKMPQKARVNTKRIHRNVLMPPGHPKNTS